MKSKKFFTVIVVLIFTLVQLGQVCSADFETTEGMLTSYTITLEGFREFVDNPSFDIIQANSLTKSVFSIFGAPDEIHEIKYYKDGKSKEYIDKAAWVRLSFPLYANAVDYLSKKSNIENLLTQNGYICNVNYYMGVFVEDPFIPLLIWVSTDAGNFYIAIDMEDWNQKLYAYTVYSQAEFSATFKKKEGTCIVNDTSIPIEFEYTRIYLPFRKVVESMGSTVTWKQETQTAYFTTPNGLYALCTFRSPYFDEASKVEEIGPDFIYYGADVPYAKNINGTIYIGYEYMKAIAKVFNTDININMESLTITVSTK